MPQERRLLRVETTQENFRALKSELLNDERVISVELEPKSTKRKPKTNEEVIQPYKDLLEKAYLDKGTILTPSLALELRAVAVDLPDNISFYDACDSLNEVQSQLDYEMRMSVRKAITRFVSSHRLHKASLGDVRKILKRKRSLKKPKIGTRYAFGAYYEAFIRIVFTPGDKETETQPLESARQLTINN